VPGDGDYHQADKQSEDPTQCECDESSNDKANTPTAAIAISPVSLGSDGLNELSGR